MADEQKHALDGKLSGRLERWRWQQAKRFIKPDDAVLDVACNEGGLIDYLPVECDYLGVDISEQALNFARQAYPNHDFLKADLSQNIPDIDKQFDVAVMLAFLEHLAEPHNIVAHVAQIIKPGGLIIVTTPAPWARPVHDIGARLGIFSKDAADEHEKFLNRNDLKRIADQAGLELSRFYYFMLGFNQMAHFRKSDI